jgi:hypothetical protein
MTDQELNDLIDERKVFKVKIHERDGDGWKATCYKVIADFGGEAIEKAKAAHRYMDDEPGREFYVWGLKEIMDGVIG